MKSKWNCTYAIERLFKACGPSNHNCKPGWPLNNEQVVTGFAYRTEVNWWMFATSGLLVLLVALLTVSFQAIKAAVANPVKSLRTE